LLEPLIVLFVNVCVPVNVATVLSIAKVSVLLPTVVSIPVPPVNVSVSPVFTVSFAPESAAIVKELTTVDHESCPAPLVCRYCEAEPSACGQFNPSSTRSPVPFGVILMSPLVSVLLIVLPFTLILSTFNSPVTLKSLPSNVKFALSSRAPLVPAITTLLSVKSLTVNVAATTSPVPFGVRLIAPFAFVDEMVLASTLILSTSN
jgi:hypothetical protein